MALGIATEAIAKGEDREVEHMQQAFFYLPLMHDERLISQIAVLALYEGLVSRCDPETQASEFAVSSIASAKSHLEAIRRFGRFPSRNKRRRKSSISRRNMRDGDLGTLKISAKSSPKAIEGGNECITTTANIIVTHHPFVEIPPPILLLSLNSRNEIRLYSSSQSLKALDLVVYFRVNGKQLLDDTYPSQGKFFLGVYLFQYFLWGDQQVLFWSPGFIECELQVCLAEGFVTHSSSQVFLSCSFFSPCYLEFPFSTVNVISSQL